MAMETESFDPPLGIGLPNFDETVDAGRRQPLLVR
jgi:hypothetical protein